MRRDQVPKRKPTKVTQSPGTDVTEATGPAGVRPMGRTTSPEGQPYLDPDRAVQDADQEHVLHQQPAGHGLGGGAGAQEDIRHRVAHVLPAVRHVQLLQLAAYGGHVRLAQPAHDRTNRATARFQIQSCFLGPFKKYLKKLRIPPADPIARGYMDPPPVTQCAWREYGILWNPQVTQVPPFQLTGGRSKAHAGFPLRQDHRDGRGGTEAGSILSRSRCVARKKLNFSTFAGAETLMSQHGDKATMSGHETHCPPCCP